MSQENEVSSPQGAATPEVESPKRPQCKHLKEDGSQCERDAYWVPVVEMLPAARFTKAKPLELEMGFEVCGMHRAEMAEKPLREVVTMEMYNAVESQCFIIGYPFPDRNRTKLKFIKCAESDPRMDLSRVSVASVS